MPRRSEYPTDSAQYAHVQNSYADTVGQPPAPGTPIYLDSPQPTPSPGFYQEKSYGDSQASFIHDNHSRERLNNYGGKSADVAPRSPPSRPGGPSGKRKALIAIFAVIGLLAVIGAVIGALVATKVIKFSSGSGSLAAVNAGTGTTGSSGSPTSAAAPASSSAAATLAQTGGDGSMVTSIDGTQTFRYNNTQGGTWDAVPFSNRAQAQADTPPLSQPFDYNVNRQRGVNFGGWLNLEPFISPAMYEPFVGTANQAVDEWTLALALDAQGAGAKQAAYERHYSTFITELDFAQVAGAGLNWIRLPVPYWMIETYAGEPFYTGAWPHFLRAIAMARKYGLRIQLDYHAAPGSQNGRLGSINFLHGPMGLANAQRALNHLRILMEFISQPQYSNVVAQITLMNEPRGMAAAIGQAPVFAFYAQAYQLLRGISGTGPGNGPMIMLGEGFVGPDQYANFLPTADRLGLDFHVYMAFDTPQATGGVAIHTDRACGVGPSFHTGQSLISAGEFSLGVNDCGRWLNGVGNGAQLSGTYANGNGVDGACANWTNVAGWTPAIKAEYLTLFNAWTDAV